jgi:hypothetical protein
MQSEKITFEYFLFITNASEPPVVSVSLNDVVIAEQRIPRMGRFKLDVTTEIVPGPAKLALNIIDAKGGSIRVENISLKWEDEELNSSWINKDHDDEHTHWSYKDPTAETMYNEAASNGARSITLDYETETVPSFLRNYATVIVDGKASSIRSAYMQGPHVFKGPGSFILDMTSPVPYWLLERLFVAI